MATTTVSVIRTVTKTIVSTTTASTLTAVTKTSRTTTVTSATSTAYATAVVSFHLDYPTDGNDGAHCIYNTASCERDPTTHPTARIILTTINSNFTVTGPSSAACLEDCANMPDCKTLFIYHTAGAFFVNCEFFAEPYNQDYIECGPGNSQVGSSEVYSRGDTRTT